MAKLTNRRRIESGKLWDAYFKAAKGDNLHECEIEKKGPFGLTKHDEIKVYTSFVCDGREYAVISYDHFNGHFSRFADESAIYGIEIATVSV